MKILHLVAGELSGGAGRGAYWLHQGLLNVGIKSHVLTTSKETYFDQTVTSLKATKKGKVLAFLRKKADFSIQNLYPHRKKVIFSVGLLGYDFTQTKEYQEADIIHLHWICGGLVNLKHLAKVNKPLVWTMRDMWPMTGGCHYSIECERYLSACGKCPQLGSQQNYDLSKFVLNRKKKYIPKTTKLIGISHWLSECARKSTLFKGFDIRTIHNNVNTQDFFPIQKSLARQILGLPDNQPIILAGAQRINIFYKGFDLYLEAINSLSFNPLFVFFGNLNLEAISSLNCFLKDNYVNLGFLYDTISLRLAYSAADVFVAPSRIDAFGKTLAESMACGTPVVCFDATGPKDIVDHKQNGYKAEPFEPIDLAQGIEWILGDEQRGEKLSANARQKVKEEFDVPVIAEHYRKLYQELL